jgi:hypothetical protein
VIDAAGEGETMLTCSSFESRFPVFSLNAKLIAYRMGKETRRLRSEK